VRTAPVAKLLREAAPTDPEVAKMLQTTRANQRRDIATALKLITGRAATRAERDGVWAIASPEVYLLLVEESGWTTQQYAAWFAGALDGVIPRS
jgi:hypothetical protein